jgi:hypothetical protein
MSNSNQIVRLWWATLGIGAAVVGAVALLLTLILAAAERIDRHASAIWQVGTTIARNTPARSWPAPPRSPKPPNRSTATSPRSPA